MPSDFEILGIERTDDAFKVKRAFRERAEGLHPDVAGNRGLDSHILFIRLNQAYRRLMASLPTASAARGDAPKAPPPSVGAFASPPTASGQISAYKDTAYAFYKRASALYQEVHPSKWAKDLDQLVGTRIPGQEAIGQEVRETVRRLARALPQAYYYFSVVANDYPDSSWAYDAAEKMAIIEKRTGQYRRILESFTRLERPAP
jgi:curved DNA-binding protein CbpA